MGVAEGLGATVGFGVLLPGGDELVLATVGVTVLPSSTLVPVGVAVPPGVSVPAPESPLPEIRVAVGVVVKIGTAIVIVDVALTGLVAEGWRETAVPVAASSPGKGVVKMGGAPLVGAVSPPPSAICVASKGETGVCVTLVMGLGEMMSRTSRYHIVCITAALPQPTGPCHCRQMPLTDMVVLLGSKLRS